MRYRLQLLQPTFDTNEFGEEYTTYKVTNTVHAERVKMNSSHGVEVGERFPAYSAEYNIRDAHTIEENWRVQEMGGYLYNVVNIIPNLDRGMRTLVCERVNE